MSNYKLASQLKLRFQTNRGLLTTEQLWDLSLTELDTLTVDLEKATKEGASKSFLVEKTEDDKIAKLLFDIAYDVLTTRIEEQKALQEAKSNKKHNERILSLIANKQDSELAEKSVDELKKLLRGQLSQGLVLPLKTITNE
jgi:hypothetical protein